MFESTDGYNRPVRLLTVDSNVNNRFVDHRKECDFLSDFQYGFRSSRSTVDLLTNTSDRIARAFVRSGNFRLGICLYFDFLRNNRLDWI